VDGHLQFPRQIQRNLGVGNVGSGFDRVNRLPAHIDSPRKIGCPHAPALSNLGQLVLNARLHRGYFLTWTTSIRVSIRTERAPGQSVGTTTRKRPCAPNRGLPCAVSANRISLSMKERSSSPSENTT